MESSSSTHLRLGYEEKESEYDVVTRRQGYEEMAAFSTTRQNLVESLQAGTLLPHEVDREEVPLGREYAVVTLRQDCAVLHHEEKE